MRNPKNVFTFCQFPLVTILLIFSCSKDDDAVFSQENTQISNNETFQESTKGEDLIFISNGPGAEYAAEGTNRYNNPYNMSIIEPLKYILSCSRANKVYIPVQGIKVLTQVDKQKSYSIDFGDGSCDNTFTVTVDGRSKTITAKNDSGS